MKQFTIMAEKVSNGYHTFEELYDHRCWLWINLCIANADECYWFEHYEGWPCLVWNSEAGQMSYHIPSDSLLKISDKIKRIEKADHKFDGHSSDDVVARLKLLSNLKSNAQESK